MRPVNTLTNPVVHQCHFDFEMGDVAEWAVCPESWGEHPSQAPAALPLSCHPPEVRTDGGTAGLGMACNGGLTHLGWQLFSPGCMQQHLSGKELLVQ